MLSIFNLFIFVLYLTSSGINSDANLRLAFLPFGKLTNQFLGTIQPNNGLNVTQKYIFQILGFKNSSTNYQTYISDLWSTYVGYIILIIIGVIFIIFFTLVGLCFCCCRCCCKKCGYKPAEPAEQNAKRRRAAYNVFLFIFATIILIGAIVSMASNVILSDAIRPSKDTTDKSGNILANLDTTSAYAVSYINYIANNGLTNGMVVLNNTMQNLLSLLPDVITQFTTTFFNELNFGSIMNITDVVINGYINLVTQSRSLSTISSLHMNKTKIFTQYLQIVFQNLSTLLNDSICQNFTECGQVNMFLPYLSLGFNGSNINYTIDINTQQLIDGYNVSDLQNAKATVLSSSNNITSQLNTTINGYLQTFSNYLNANSSIFQFYNNVFAYKNVLINFINSTISNLINNKVGGTTIQDGGIYNYYKWVFYGFICLIGITLLIILLFYVGLCFGICGGPNFEDAPCCSKAAGSGFYMGAVALSFLFGWLIMFIVMIMFITGGLLQTEVCRYLSPNTNPSFIRTIDDIINKTLTTINMSVPFNNDTITIPDINVLQSIMINCPVSTNLISAFNIPTSYINTISGIMYQQFITPNLNNLVSQINNYAVPNINVNSIVNSTKNILLILNQLNAINNAPTLTELKNPTINMPDIAGFLNAVNNLAVATNKTSPSFSLSLLSTTSNFNALVIDMTSTHNSYLAVKTSFIALYTSMTSPLSTLINYLSLLPSKTSDAKTKAFQNANNTLVQNTTSLVNKTIFGILLSLGNCQGLSVTFFSAVSIVCSTFLVPFNNLWMGLGWFLLFIIPTIIISLKLHRIYRITHIESNTSRHNNAYQASNNYLSESDMEMIRMARPQKY